MRHFLIITTLCAAMLSGCTPKDQILDFGNGTLTLTAIQDDAVRIRYTEGEVRDLPEMVYEETKAKASLKKTSEEGRTVFSTAAMTITVDNAEGTVSIADAEGKEVFKATGHELKASQIQGEATREASLTLDSPQDEYLYGLGQFQDGFLNVKGLTRRLTQVNTQIAVPFLMSSKGYGILWNNYGLTDFNPADNKIVMQRGAAEGEERRVNVTSTEGGRWETRRNNNFEAEVEIPEDGQYAVLLDVGQKMARRHNLSIDGETVADLRNSWLPPTTTVIVPLTAGKHQFKAELERGDNPVLYFRKIEDNTSSAHLLRNVWIIPYSPEMLTMSSHHIVKQLEKLLCFLRGLSDISTAVKDSTRRRNFSQQQKDSVKSRFLST